MSSNGATRIHADLSRAAAVNTRALPWVPSPQAGVERRMLDRDGDEVARATSLVRYAPDSTFPEHAHDLGEEYLVLSGTFRDQHGAYPAGTYVRNPPGSSHAPFTREGCIILVKLRQMRPEGEPAVVVDTRAEPWAGGDEFARKVLFDAAWGEHVALERLGGETPVPEDDEGLEMLILEGCVRSADDRFEAGHWLRFPRGQAAGLRAEGGVEYWVKRGHL